MINLPLTVTRMTAGLLFVALTAIPVCGQTTRAIGEPERKPITQVDASGPQPGETAEAYANRMMDLYRNGTVPAESEQSRGIPLFNRRWDYDINFTSKQFVDLEGNLIIAYQKGFFLGVQVEKLEVANNDGPNAIWSINIPSMLTVESVRADLNGGIYVGGLLDLPGNTESAGVVKLRADNGAVLWESSPVFATSTPFLNDLELDPEGVPYFSLGNLDFGRVTRLDPVTGAEAWSVDLIEDVDTYSILAVSRTGAVYAAYVRVFMGNADRLYISRLQPDTGLIEWTWESASDEAWFPRDIETDRDGNVYVVGGRGTFSQNSFLISISPDGTPNFSRDLQPGAASGVGNVEISRAQDIIVAGAVNPTGTFVQSWDRSGTKMWEWDGPTGNEGSSSKAAVDRIGNVYVHTESGADQYIAKIDIGELGSDPGATIWQDTRSGLDEFFAVDVVVDNGMSLYLVGSSEEPNRVIVTKYTQPFLGIPILQTACPNLMLENQGVWAPGVGSIEEEGVIWEVPSWDFDTNSIPLQDFFITPVGEFGGGPRLRANGEMTLGYKAEVNGGSADFNFPMGTQFLIPPFTKLFAGVVIPDIPTDWDPDPAARMTSNATPTVDAGLTAETDGEVYADLKLTAFSAEILDLTLVDTDWDVSPPDYIPPLHVLGLLGQFGFPAPGEWFTVADSNGIFTGSVRFPKLSAKANFNPTTNSFQTNVEADFLKLRLSLTQAILKAFGFTATYEQVLGDEDDTFYAALSVAFAQALFGVNLGADQTLTVEVTPRVRYEFSDGLPDLDLALGEPISGVVMPPDGTLEITPFAYATATFDNDTDMTLSPTAGFNTIEFSVAADFDGWRLVGLSECLLCIDEELVTFNIDIFNAGWPLLFPEVELAPMRLTGSTDVQPRVFAASRDNLSMIIYDQTSPTQSKFNVSTRGGSRMLIFGDRLFDSSEAVIKHHGRTECLPTTWINNQTLLVEIPNRFRLLPGVAKLWVESSFGISDSIDMPITYPTPLLDAVNPNLWSADPDMNTLPVAVIDRQTSIGNDTFIARRDYYIKMREDLWNPSTAPGNPTYTSSASDSIPDGTGAFIADTMEIVDGGTITDMNLRLVINHTWNGDLIVRLSHGGTTVTVVDRPGYSGSGFGFDNNGLNIILDDEGDGGLIEDVDSPSGVISPPSYVPNNPLSAFDGMDRSGTWTIEVSDNAGQDMGALVGWSLEFEGTGGISAPGYFPCFDFDAMPAFPAVLFNGSPMERYAQPVDNGIHNVRLAEADYNTPRLIPVVLCNPGPGGGMGNTLDLTIAAPRPAVSSIEPREVEPDTDDFELIVRGPKHVPFWSGYEEPKYGNFNRASVIRFNGMDLPTTFVGSAELRTMVPASLINGQERNHTVSVFTPANGTSYFEELRNGDDEIVFQGLVSSGGESGALLFRSRYRDPVITMLSPNSTVAGNVAFDMGTQQYNLTVCGENFRSTSVVQIGGEDRPTNFVSHSMLEATLMPEDVLSPRITQIRVRNFNGATSQGAEFLVTQPPPAPAPGVTKTPPINREATITPHHSQ